MTTRSAPPRIPAAAERLRRPLWLSAQERTRRRWGFDLDAPDALERAHALVEASPGDADALLLEAAALAVRGRAEDAERQVRRALEVQPRHARARTTLATLLVNRGAAAEGLEEARNAFALDKEDAQILYNLGLAEWFAGDRKHARAAFARAAEAHARASGGGEPRPPWWRRLRRR